MNNLTYDTGAFNGNIAAPRAASTNAFLTSTQVAARYGSVSQMTIWRWLRDKERNFPQPIYLGRRRFWRLADLEAWEAEQAGRGADASHE